MYIKIINGKRPHQNHLCNILGVSEQDYLLWLRILLMLFIKIEKDGVIINLLEYYIRNIFNNSNYYKYIVIGFYDSNNVLLSDRGFNSLDTNEYSISEFNLISSSFINYIFTPLDLFIQNKTSDMRFQKNFVDQMAYFNQDLIDVAYAENDKDFLDVYNKRTIYQAHSHVFCANKNINDIIGGKMAIENDFI